MLPNRLRHLFNFLHRRVHIVVVIERGLQGIYLLGGVDGSAPAGLTVIWQTFIGYVHSQNMLIFAQTYIALHIWINGV